MQLAQMNIGRGRTPLDDPALDTFRAELDRINALAERMPGFVWRFQDETGNAMDVQGFADPRIAINVTVWESPEALERFVWRTVHAKVYARKAEWFEPMDRPHLVMWWVEDGHRPSVAEAVARIEHLWAHGDTDHAFGWRHRETTPLWRERRCA